MEEYLDNDDRMNCGNGGLESMDFEVTLLEPRPFRPFKSSEEYLYAMKEDLAEWLNGLYEELDLTADNFLEQMETGVILCQHANNVVRKAREYYKTIGAPGEVPISDRDVVYRSDVLPETFHARDNVSNFISWCRALAIKECLLFETDDLVLRKNERSFILCLLEVARRGAKFGMPAPLLVQLEQEIDAELANDDGYQTTLDHHRVQVVTNDLRSLHERVVDLLSRCTCPSQFPMIRVADGKYRIGDTKVLIFVRILRSHVMVRVGGGWDTLEHYLDKHDPCRCRSGHRLSTSAKLTMHHGKSNIPNMHVTYNRPPQPPSLTPTSSPKIQRRSISHQHHHNNQQYGSHYNALKPERNESPPGYHHQISSSTATHCSDDSSASNPSLHDSSSINNNNIDASRKIQKKKNHQLQGQRNHSAGSTSEDVSDEDDLPTDILPRSPQMSIRQRMAKRDSLKGTVPSSWQYTPISANIHLQANNNLVSRKNSNGINKPTVAIAGISNGSSCSTRLPSLANRAKNQSPPPRILKVSPNIQCQQKWSDQRSQSSEDLFQDSNSGPAIDRNLIFHSRGTSPVNIKGRQSVGFSHRLDTPKDLPPTSFRRCDPVRHSSYHTPRNYVKTRAPQRPMQSAELKRMPQVNQCKGPMLPRQPSPPGKYLANPTYKKTSPILEKLLQRSDLCADASFMKKIEMLIMEYESKNDLMDMKFNSRIGPRSLPTDIQEKIDSASYPRRSSKDDDGKTPSKIPVPRWQ